MRAQNIFFNTSCMVRYLQRPWYSVKNAVAFGLQCDEDVKEPNYQEVFKMLKPSSP